MDQQLLSIGETAKRLGVSIDTLRKWEENGALKSFRPIPTGNRYYRVEDINRFLEGGDQPYAGDLISLAKSWVISEPTEPPSSLYCKTSDVFHARLQHLEIELANRPELKDILPLIIAVAGEIGNNSYNHNIGNWPDISGTLFGYDLKQRQVVLADRGQGIYATLKRVEKTLKNDEEALIVAFTKYISGRAPEERGNGLKFVKDVVTANPLHLTFQTGDSELELEEQSTDLKIQKANIPFRGCIAIINY